MSVLIENDHVLVSKGTLILLLGADQGAFLDWLISEDPIAKRMDKALSLTGMVDLESPMLRDPQQGLITYLVATEVLSASTVGVIDEFIADQKGLPLAGEDEDPDPRSLKAHRWTLPVPQGELPTQYCGQYFSDSFFVAMSGTVATVWTDQDTCTADGAVQEV